MDNLLATRRESRHPRYEGENVLGRDSTATVRLESMRISRYHARIVLSEKDATLEDLGSKNGTFLQGERIAEPARLQQGDRFASGRSRSLSTSAVRAQHRDGGGLVVRSSVKLELVAGGWELEAGSWELIRT